MKLDPFVLAAGAITVVALVWIIAFLLPTEFAAEGRETIAILHHQVKQ